jgi:16S rRNA (adenine1518-N6/adenine1519-N6)-dimethyltransferase
VHPRKFQTKSDIRQLLARTGFKPKRRLGQNFLIDGNLMNRLLNTAAPTREDGVLEVGAGTGGLTEHLADFAGRVVSVELDTMLYRIVAERLGQADNVRLVHADALASKHRLAPELTEALHELRQAVGGRLMLVANLPYGVATPLLANLLLQPLTLDRFCFTVQREVADRLTARPGTRDFGPISILMQCTCRFKRVATLPAQVFWPQPAVESTMIRADHERNPLESTERLHRFMNFLRQAFAHRRKTLKFNLTKAAGEEACRSAANLVDLSARPESLSANQWLALAEHLDI